MPVFRVSTRDGKISLVVRAYCFACARKVAAIHTPADEFATWSNADLVKIDHIDTPERFGYVSKGSDAILNRIDK